ncbi:MAG TPA: hypothetical protein VGM90_00895 [Kofleriaceae bacterium]|jgi:hypothetical protein
MRRLLPLLALLAACGEPAIEVKPSSGSESDYNERELQTAVDKYVAAKKTPAAFKALSIELKRLRAGMDHTVAEQAELRLITLALTPVDAVKTNTMPEQVEALALDVWPTLLQKPLAADEVLSNPDPGEALLQPLADEDAREYLRRLCGGVLASECKEVVPEQQGAIVAALANRRAMERVRNAVAECQSCATEAGWHDAVRGWEELDRVSHAAIHDVERRGRPDNWPVAGSAAEDSAAMTDPTTLWREAEINAIGEVEINGHQYLGDARVAALRELRADSDTITLHLRPEITLGQVKGILEDAKKSGATKVAVVARTSEYPWDRKIYWLSDAGQTRVGLRTTDSLQMLLHALDHVASPGAVARVD